MDGPKPILTLEPLLDAVRPILSDLPHLQAVFVVGGSDPAGHTCSAELAASDLAPVAHTSPDETAFWLYSSGSTGAPKGVRHVHTSPAYVADTYGRNVLGIRHDDICFSAAKLPNTPV